MSRGVGQARVAKLQWKGNCRFWATYTRHFIHNLAVACVQYCSFLFGLFNFLNPQFCEAGVNLTDDAIRVRMGPCIKLFDVIAQLCTAEGGLDSMRICRTAGPKLAHFGCIYLCVCVCFFWMLSRYGILQKSSVWPHWNVGWSSLFPRAHIGWATLRKL